MSRKVLKTNNLLQEIGFGENNTVASIKGSVKKLGSQYKDAIVALFNKRNLDPISATKPSETGDYHFSGLNNSLVTFVIAFDNNKQYNAVIQDNVVPK